MLFKNLLTVEVSDTTKIAEDIEEKVASVSKLASAVSKYSTDEIITLLIENLAKLGLKIALAIAIFVIGKWIVKKIDFLLSKIMEKRKVEVSLRTFTKSFVRIALNLLIIVFIIGVLGIDTTSFVALFASAGVAIGMALSGTLQNFAGGVMILLFKPYKVGDFIVAQGYMGIVKEIQIINTIINTPDNKIIMIPNGRVSTDWSSGV